MYVTTRDPRPIFMVMLTVFFLINMAVIMYSVMESSDLKEQIKGINQCYFQYTVAADKKLNEACDEIKLRKTQIRQLKRYAEQGTKEELMDAFKRAIDD